MTEEQRIEYMNSQAPEYLLALPDTLTKENRDQLTNIAHLMRKFGQLVVDRDAGPSLDIKSAKTKADEDLRQAIAEKEALALQLETTKAALEETKVTLDAAQEKIAEVK